MSKYQVCQRSRFRMRHDTPRLTDHVVGGMNEGIGRWDERMPLDAHAPETVLKEATVIDEATDLPPWRNGNVEAIHIARCASEEGEYVPIFVQNNGNIVTTYRTRTLEQLPTKSYLLTVADQLPVIE